MDLHVTFLLSIYMCLTKSLAKHSEIDFQREFSSDTLRCFEQQLVFGEKSEVVGMLYKGDASCCACWWSLLEATASEVWDIKPWEMVPCGGKGRAVEPICS